MAVESTLLIVKPDGVRRGLVGEVLRRVEAKGLAIAEMRMMTIERALTEEHYAEHSDKPFFGEPVDFITSGPVVVARLEGERTIEVLRTMMGPTDPATAPIIPSQPIQTKSSRAIPTMAWRTNSMPSRPLWSAVRHCAAVVARSAAR